MRLSIVSTALTAAFVLAPGIVGHAPALAQDFSITNPVEPLDAGRRDVVRQLQAWWDVHAYYPKRASQSEESGIVTIRLIIRPDGNVFMVNVVGSSGSSSLDAAGAAAFRGGFVRPFPAGVPEAVLEVSLHYVFAHPHDQTVTSG